MERLIGFTMVLTRVSAFFLVVPVFGSTAIPVMIRVAATVMLSVFFAGLVPLPGHIATASAAQIGLTLVGEATYGFLLGPDRVHAVLGGPVQRRDHRAADGLLHL